ncbi:hypothetical protein B0H34DRAFT_454358 [Crassisporium funariophilum]|nr:hypothetical protein B0H34DRAFT_454358 [Crassisporium funariophilum]
MTVSIGDRRCPSLAIRLAAVVLDPPDTFCARACGESVDHSSIIVLDKYPLHHSFLIRRAMPATNYLCQIPFRKCCLLPAWLARSCALSDCVVTLSPLLLLGLHKSDFDRPLMSYLLLANRSTTRNCTGKSYPGLMEIHRNAVFPDSLWTLVLKCKTTR